LEASSLLPFVFSSAFCLLPSAFASALHRLNLGFTIAFDNAPKLNAKPTLNR
jgi:hypothetical protein